MEPKVQRLLSLIREHEKIKKIYLSCYENLSIIRDELRAGKFQVEDMINFIYVAREISKLVNDLRKEIDGVGHMFENTACAIYVSLNRTDPIRSSLATGTPDLRLAVKIPNQNRDPEEFTKLMKFLEIPDKAISDKVIKLHWPGLCEYVSVLAEEGQPLPPGINPDDTYPIYSVRIRGIKNLDELTRALDQAGRKETDAACNELLTTRK